MTDKTLGQAYGRCTESEAEFHQLKKDGVPERRCPYCRNVFRHGRYSILQQIVQRHITKKHPEKQEASA